MEFSLDNVDYQINLSNTKSEDDGVTAERYKAELKAGPKKVVIEKTLNGGDVDYNIRGEGPGMDDEAERKRFLRSWALVVFGQIFEYLNIFEINDTDQDDQFKQTITSFLKLYKHFFEPRLLSLLGENPDSSENSDLNYHDMGSFSGISENAMPSSASNSGIPENAMPSSSLDSESGNDADDMNADSGNDTDDMDSDSGNDTDDINSDSGNDADDMDPDSDNAEDDLPSSETDSSSDDD